MTAPARFVLQPRLLRLLAQVLLLPILWLVQQELPSLFVDIVGVGLLVAWPVSVAVAIILNLLVWIANREQRDLPRTAIEAADNAVSVALFQTGLAAIALVRVLGVAHTGDSMLVVLLAWAVLVGTLPSFSWLGTLHRVWLPAFARRLVD